MSLEQIISEHTLATRDLTAAVSQLTDVLKNVGLLTSAPALPGGVFIPALANATSDNPVPFVAGHGSGAVTPINAEPAAQQPVFNAAEVAADPLARPAPAQASPAPSASTVAAAPTAAPTTTQSQPAQSGREYSQAEFLAVMKAYGNGQTAKGVAVERAPAGFLQGVLANCGLSNFKEVPAAKYAEILAGVPAAVVQAALEV